MKYVSTYLMLVMGGNDSPSAADVTAALEKVGVDVDAADLKRFLAGVEGKDLAEVLAAGKEKLAKFGGGGGGGGGGDVCLDLIDHLSYACTCTRAIWY